jgi:hypothetical protein
LAPAELAVTDRAPGALRQRPTQVGDRSKAAPRPAAALALAPARRPHPPQAAAYAGLPAPFLLRLVAQRKLACWKTEGPSETGEGYFFARADLEALRPAGEEAG